MTIDLAHLMSLRTSKRLRFSVRDAHIYAHGVGLGRDPRDRVELGYFHDAAPKVFPTLLTALALTGGPLTSAGLNMRGVLHGAQSLTLHGQAPPDADIEMSAEVVGAWDRGPGKGLVLLEQKTLMAAGEPIATLLATVMSRLDQGVHGSALRQPGAHAVPARAPDHHVEIETAPNQALLYRLSGDLNPIHSDPEIALAAGFERPILHGLCTYALCARAVVDSYGGRAPERLRHIEARFSAPLIPGDNLRVLLWRDDDVISFQADVPARDVVVVKGGKAVLVAA